MTTDEIENTIILPFNALVKKQRLEAIRKERDRELTLAPALSKKSVDIVYLK